MQKTTLKPRALTRIEGTWKRVAGFARRTPVATCAGAFFGAFVLAALPLGDGPSPVAAGAILAVPFFPHSLLATLGCLAGYCLRWPWATALEPVAVTVLAFAGAGLFHDVGLAERPWFPPALFAAIAASVGAVFVLDAGFTGQTLLLFLGKLVLAGLAPAVLRRALAEREPIAICLSALGLFAGFAWLLPPATCYLAALGGGAFAVLYARGAALPVRLPERARPPSEAELPLRRVSRVLAGMHRSLADVPPEACRSEIADVYDSAAETVCRLCVRNQLCWERQAEQTYRELCAAAEPIVQRGSAVREDFPAEFSDRCRHMEGFLTAVNQALEAGRSQRQLHNRLHESRRILAGQYLLLSRFLGRLADDERRPPLPAPQFTPDFAVRSVCRGGGAVCGDRGASFRDRWNHFFVLLCDGMGSGEAAAQESGRAVRTLTGLLESGVAPDAALEMLNGFYVLRGSGAFSTVDLLKVDLTTGAAVLYKWGAAPSYIKQGGEVQKIGTVSPPPGLDVAAGHTAEQLRLSLRDGETLIMVSDGAFGEATQRRAAQFGGTGSRELATWLIDRQDAREDDLTAAVVRLQRLGGGGRS